MFKDHTQQSHTRSTRSLAIVALFSVMAVGTLGGCQTAGEGLVTGAALGAITGLAIGSINGEAGEGAAIGAILGGVGGSIIGDQNDDRRRNNGYSRRSTRQSSHRTYQHRHRDRCDDGYRSGDWWND